MKRKLMQSTCVKSYGYDANKRLFEIEYPSGEIYDYLNVPPSVHQEFLRSDSKGEFVNFRIKQFLCKKISSDC